MLKYCNRTTKIHQWSKFIRCQNKKLVIADIMSASVLSNDKEMKTVNAEEELIDVEYYRKLIRTFIDLRRYNTALFWAEKVVKLSCDDPRDIYWLAQCMFLLKEYHRAAHIIKSKGLEKVHIMCHYLVVESLLEAKEYQEALEILNSVDADDLTNIAMQSCDEELFGDQFGFEKSMKNEILASICFIKGKVLESMDNRTLSMDYYVQALQKSVYCAEALDALVQHEMLMAWEERELMQHLPLKQQCFPADAKVIHRLYESKLKKYYNSVYPQRNAEQTPIGNFGSLQSIQKLSERFNTEKTAPKQTKQENLNVGSRLFTPTMQIIMSPANKILNDLRNTPTYSIHTSLSKLSTLHDTNKSTNSSFNKTNKPTKQNLDYCITLKLCIERLEKSVDLMVAKAETLFYNCEYTKCLKFVDEILMGDPYHSRCLTIQIGCLVEMKEFNKLFYVAHKLVDLYPDQAISWYAVGCYYDIIGKSDPARRYLMKATSLDRLFGPAWLAYGHSFARENEHDQAMAAYFKATQLMRGCHLPLLYIGVECGLTKNLELAEKFFYQAMAIAPLDVFVLHELGVIKFEYEYYESAEEVFRMTLEMVKNLAVKTMEPIASRWEPLLNNLGHCCRKNRKYEEALQFHQRALMLQPQKSSTYTAIGFVQALMGKLEEASDSLHKSLSLKRDDIFATTLLKYVIEDLVEDDDIFSEQPTENIQFIEEDMSKSELFSPEFVKLNCVKLKFDDCDSNASQNSEPNFNMSLDFEMDMQ